MDSTSLHGVFRSEMKDDVRPYFWTDDDIFRYMNAAYREFVRLIGGISDFTSEACEVEITTGEAVSDLHPSLLRIMSASRRSDNHDIMIINSTDLGKLKVRDYGTVSTLRLDNTSGPVRYGVIGMQKGKIRWINIPIEDDVAEMIIYRLPLKTIDDFDQALDEIDEDHHMHLFDGMKQYAYLKTDAEVYDPKASDKAKFDFEAYALRVKGELERYQHKPREVVYGGL